MGDYATNRFPTKDEFLKNKEIADFIRSTRDEYLNDSLPEEIEDRISGRILDWNKHSENLGYSFSPSHRYPHSFIHQYEHKKPRYYWECRSLIHAATAYRFKIHLGSLPQTSAKWKLAVWRWDGYDSLHANNAVLHALSRQLRSAYAANDHAGASEAAEAIQLWGGTRKGNLAQIKARSKFFCDYLKRCEAAFGHGNDLTLGPFHSHPSDLRSTAGFSKIYSLLFDDFVIDDSRVAAALGMLIIRYAARHGVLPHFLSDLVWMKGQTGRMRNPSCGPYHLSKLTGTARSKSLNTCAAI